jgi:hypothetical protein
MNGKLNRCAHPVAAGAILLGAIAAVGASRLGNEGESQTPAAPPDLNALAWMAGYWKGEVGGQMMEECWMAPSGRMMVGMHRDVRGERPAFFEFLRIEQTADAIVYTASPRGAAPTAFELTESGERRAVFSNPEHDYPQRIIYWRVGEDELRARIEGETPAGPRASEWAWKRAELTPPAPKSAR